jgi:hypothetical protein
MSLERICSLFPYSLFDGGSCGRKFPTINAGLCSSSIISLVPFALRLMLSRRRRVTYSLCSSRRIVKEKQHLTIGWFDVSLGFLSEHAVNSVSCAGSNAIVPNSSQYRTIDSSVNISCKAILPCHPVSTRHSPHQIWVPKNSHLAVDQPARQSVLPSPCCP